METGGPTIIPTRNELIKLRYLHIKSMGNDGYLYLLDQQTPYIWKKVQIGSTAVGNILQSD